MNHEILKKLQKIIEGKSANALRRVYPEQLQKWLETNAEETVIFLDELKREGLIVYKYDFECSCGNDCTAYLNKIQRELYLCKNCGKSYTFEDIQKLGMLVCELDKKLLLNYDEIVVDFKYKLKQYDEIEHTDNRKGELTIMEKKKIFIGSSSSVIPEMEVIARIIDDLGYEALPWNAKGKGLFVAGQYTFDNLIKITQKVHGAIFMFNAEDATWYSDKCELKKEVRDNVLLEYGLFVGALGKEKVTFICNGKPKIATDLLGITYLNGEQTEYQLKPDLQDWLAQI